MSSPGCYDEAAPLVVGPDCTVRSIAAIRATILHAGPSGHILRLDCSGIEQADLSFVQLIASAQATWAGSVMLEAAPDCVRASFARAGVTLPGHQPYQAA